MDVTDREDDTMEQKEDDQYTSQRQRPGTDPHSQRSENTTKICLHLNRKLLVFRPVRW